jgi:UDP-N-acetylmuramoyl-L-alanyl-D-glutamate--2,6-diaminopimelate ligase
VTLGQLAAACRATLRGEATLPAGGITHRSHDVRPGWVFAALPGARRHGIEFAAEAAERGATAVLSDREPPAPLAWLASEQPRRAAALASWALAGSPQRRLRLVGITGTNGKSTVADLVGRIAERAGETPGVFGTLTYRLPQRSETAGRTTPEAPDLAPLLAELAGTGGTVAVMEVSSHALRLDRVAGLEFDVAVWTNLTRDHLDFHADLDDYFAAKASLVDLLRAAPPGRRVIGADDPMIARLAESPRAGDLTFGLNPGCDVTAADVRLTDAGTTFRLLAPSGERAAHLPLIGRHNLRNALAAAAAAEALGWPPDAVTAGLAAAAPLPGRLEPIDAGTPFPVLVDYAHTPDALTQVLEALRETSDRRLIVVFGAGGDRDPGKRAPMGEAVARIADVPIVTTDNPRSEDPDRIIAQVLEGVRRAGNPRALVIADRREAIAAALSMADERSLVLVAGKGHERAQLFADRAVPFEDREVVREVAREVARRRKG